MAICVVPANYPNTCRRKKYQRNGKSSATRENFSIFPRPTHNQQKKREKKKKYPELSGELHQQIVYMSNQTDIADVRDLQPLRSSSQFAANCMTEIKHKLGVERGGLEKVREKSTNIPGKNFPTRRRQKQKMQK